MLAKTDVSKIYETVLSIPGMTDNVKISFSIPRKHVLLLSKVIERGLSVKNGDDKMFGILDIVPQQSLEEIQTLPADLLEKAGLSEMNEKLKAL